MKKIKITWEVEYKEEDKNIPETFGATEEELLNLRNKCLEVSTDKDLNATELLAHLLEEGLITDAAGFTLLTLGLQAL